MLWECGIVKCLYGIMTGCVLLLLPIVHASAEDIEGLSEDPLRRVRRYERLSRSYKDPLIDGRTRHFGKIAQSNVGQKLVPTGPSLTNLFSEARRQYYEGNEERSLKLLKEYSLKLLQKSKRHAEDAKLLGEAYKWIGLCYHRLNERKGETTLAFKMALKVDPVQSVNADTHGNTVAKVLEEVRKSLLAEIVVRSIGAESLSVMLNGEKVGSTPLIRRMPVGKYQIEAYTHGGLKRYGGIAIIYYGKKNVFPPRSFAVAPGVDREDTKSTDPKDKGDDWGHKRHIGRHNSTSNDVDDEVDDDVCGWCWSFKGRLWTWIVAGSALASATAAIGLGASFCLDYDEYKETNDRQRFDELEESIPEKMTGANVMWAVAGALAVVSVVLYYIEGRNIDFEEEVDSKVEWHQFAVAPMFGMEKSVMMLIRF